jgi:hypothetical protein
MSDREDEALLRSILDAVRTQSATYATFTNGVAETLHELDKKAALLEQQLASIKEMRVADALKIASLENALQDIRLKHGIKLAGISAVVSGVVAVGGKIFF